MNMYALWSPLLIGSVCLAGITEVHDTRSAGMGVLLLNGTEDINDDLLIESSDVSSVFDGMLDRRINDPIGGLLEARVEYTSTISTNGFDSSATAYANTLTPETGFTFASTAFENSVIFTLDETTTFSIIADLWASGSNDWAELYFGQLLPTQEVSLYSVLVFNDARHIEDLLTLGAGTYRFSAINAAGVDSFGRTSDTGESSLNAQVRVVPSPPVLLLISAGGIAMTRSRRS